MSQCTPSTIIMKKIKAKVKTKTEEEEEEAKGVFTQN
jgi:hypothetical protein